MSLPVSRFLSSTVLIYEMCLSLDKRVVLSSRLSQLTEYVTQLKARRRSENGPLDEHFVISIIQRLSSVFDRPLECLRT